MAPFNFSRTAPLRIGVDIGGTFTDFFLFDPGNNEVSTYKILSTPDNPAQAVLQGLEHLGLSPLNRPLDLLHGSTVATNALLERKGARTALVTTRGFGDLLEIGRQNRPELYNLAYQPPAPLVPRSLRFELDERVDYQGRVLTPLEATQIETLLPQLQAQEVEAVAVCFLFSFLHPAHETQVAQTLRQAGYFVSASHEILPEYREYERAATTVINAYVSPVLDRYLETLETHLQDLQENSTTHPPVHLRVMQSNGGIISVKEARRNGVRCILSGPAGGIVGAEYIARQADETAEPLRLITFDMGGTSTDVSLIDQAPRLTTEVHIDGLPVRIPMLDIHTIGAGGGSIAQVDLGGALRVGPQSASADPGPACYGRIDPAAHPDKAFPTVTDANLVLGRLLPDQFLGGEMPLRVDFAWQVFERLGKQLGLQKPLRSQRPKEKTAAIRAALGVIAVVNANMERALRVISVERGHDPRRFSLLSYGGAGGLHAAELARHLGIPRLLISPYASTLSALGMLAADVAKDYTQTVMLPGDTSASQLHEKLTLLLEQGQRDLEAEGLKVEDLQFQTSLDMRYQGQSYELTIPWKPDSDWLETFHRTHHQTYGYARPEAAVEIVNLRLRAVGLTRRACSQPPGLPRFPQGAGSPEQALLRRSPVVLNNAETHSLPVYRWEKLPPGSQILGPALILRPDTTLFLGIGDQAQVDSFQNLRVVIAPARKKES